MTPSETDLLRLGTAVHAAIGRAGTNRCALARRANLGWDTVGNLCAGKTTPSLNTLAAIAEALGLPSVCECLARHFDGDAPGGDL